jgi:hypothetical protein
MNLKRTQNHNPAASLFQYMPINRSMVFGVIIITALLAFEVFNYGTTEFALTDLLGDLSFAGLPWATILSIAFCGIDFAGIARLFTPEGGSSRHNEVWYLFGAWILAATMNAMLTWWGVSLAILDHQTLGNAIIEHTTLLRIVPIFVAILVWLIRVLIIGTFSVSGEGMFGVNEERSRSETHIPSHIFSPERVRSLSQHPLAASPRATTSVASMQVARPAPKPTSNKPEPGSHRLEPSHQSLFDATEKPSVAQLESIDSISSRQTNTSHHF